MKINFDQELKVDNQADINLYGKQVHVVLNDEFRQKLTASRLKIDAVYAKFDDPAYTKKVSEKPYQEQQKIADQLMDKTHKIVISTVDGLLGQGIGEYLYKHFNGSTEAVSAVLGLLEDYANESVTNLKEQKKKAKLAKYKNHH